MNTQVTWSMSIYYWTQRDTQATKGHHHIEYGVASTMKTASGKWKIQVYIKIEL